MAQLMITATAPDIEVKPAGAGKGLGVFTKRSLSLGDMIMGIERPLLTALDVELLQEMCYECHRRIGDIPIETQLGFEPCPLIRKPGDEQEVRLQRCTGCRTVYYCGKVCQKSSWSAHHSLECPVFKAASMQIPNHMRAVLRLLLLKKDGRVKSEDWDALVACPSHASDYIGLKKMEELAELKPMAKAVVLLTGSTFEEDLVMGLFLRVKINSVTLQTPFHDPLGLAMHPLLAKINHSCDPNCCVRFPCLYPSSRTTAGANPYSIIVVALRKLRTGEEITIPYIGETMSVRYRKTELENQYFFTCRCAKCLRDEQADANMDEIQRVKLFKIQDEWRKEIDEAYRDNTPFPLDQTRNKQLTDTMRLLFTYKDLPLDVYPFSSLLHQLILRYLHEQNFQMAIQLTLLQHIRVHDALSLSSVNPVRLVYTFMLIKMIATTLHQISSTPEARSESTMRIGKLASEVDLDLLHQIKIKELITNASRVWKEQPWPWMLEMLNERGMPMLQHQTKRALEQKRAKIEALCDHTLELLRNGSIVLP